MKARFYFSRSRGRRRKGPLVESTDLSGRFVAWRRDAEGKRWAYEFNPPVEVGKDVTELRVPDLRKVSLAVVTKIEGREARVALQVKAGDPKGGADISDVKKSGRSVACTPEVVDRDGKVVHSAKGDLQEFGFT